MPNTYSPNLRLTEQGIGENPNTWGNILNTVIGLIDDSVAGITEFSLSTGSDITLTQSNGSPDQSRASTLIMSGTPSTNINIFVPSGLTKIYNLRYSISGSNSIAIKTNISSSFINLQSTNGLFGSGIIYCDGTDLFWLTTPQRIISMWSGSLASIPTGYVLCDGTNNSPNTTNRFILAASNTNAPGTTGGSSTITPSGTISNAGSHSHGGNTLGHTLTIAEMPYHDHGITNGQRMVTNAGPTFDGVSGASISLSAIWQSQGGNQAHSHPIQADGLHTHTFSGNSVSITPLYFALAFIMKV